ncbi:hypothetical protein HN814_02895 [Candidatus Woesearchaeota archaeon]|nr:hypothetical protein [Candidatus Woesearchaeota archaeon]
MFGCTQTENTNTETNLDNLTENGPVETNTASEPTINVGPAGNVVHNGELCNNDEYSTEKVSFESKASSFRYENFIMLDKQSELKLLDYGFDLKGLNIKERQARNKQALQRISNLSCIDGLELNQTEFDYSHLKSFPNLRYLQLGNTKFNDLSLISNLTKLQYLDLYFTGVTDISQLSNFTNLTHLTLNGLEINNFTVLSKLSNLESLTLTKTNITDISLLSNHKKLVYFHANDTKITDFSPLLNSEYLHYITVPKDICEEVKNLFKGKTTKPTHDIYITTVQVTCS